MHRLGSTRGIGAKGLFTGGGDRVADWLLRNGGTASVGGAIYWASTSQATGSILIENNTFRENRAFQGGGIYGHRGTVSLLSNTFINNTVALESAGVEPNQPGFESVLMQGGAAYLSSVDLLLGDSIFYTNQSTHSGGALAIVGHNQIDRLPPRVHNNLFLGNTAGRDGGAIVLTDGSEPNIVNCSILYNVATGSGFYDRGAGGGLSVTAGSRATTENCLLWGNTAYSGPQMSLLDPNGGDIYQLSYALVTHCMVQGGESGIATPPGGFLTYETNNIHTGTPGFVYDHITQPDQFIYNYSLANDSPCVDAGSIDLESPEPGKQPVLPLGRYAYTLRTDTQRDTDTIDIGYHRRKVGEYPVGDIDFSGVVDLLDVAAMTTYYMQMCQYPDWCEGADLNKSGMVTPVDMAHLAQLFGAGDVTAPVPNPPQWLIIPTANSSTSITMTAVTGRDNSGNAVEYLFESVSSGGTSSGWQTSPTYTDTGLTTGQEYGYMFKMRDVIPDDPGRHNETGWSPALYGYAGEDGRAPNPNPSQWEVAPYATSSTSVAMTAVTAIDASGVEYYFRCESGHNGYDSGWQSSPSFINTGLTSATQYTYSVRTRDKSTAKNTGGLSEVRSAFTFSEPDTTPPTPAQVQWLIRPYAYSDTGAFMGAVLANDVSGVEYYFECTRGGHDYDSGWQLSNYYEVTGLMPDTTYTFVAHVRDRSPNRNVCVPSTAVTFTTLTVITGVGIPPFPNPMDFSGTSAWSGASTGVPTQVLAFEIDEPLAGPVGYYHVMTALPAFDFTGSPLGVEYYFECVTYPKLSSGWIAWIFDEGGTLGSFYYVRVGDINWPKKYVWRVKARDIWGIETQWSPGYMAGGN